MRRNIYSILCLLIFLTGLIQPALPLIEYYTFQESIIELFCVNKDKPDMDCDGICYLKKQVKKHHDSEHHLPERLIALENILIMTLPEIATAFSPPKMSDRWYPDRNEHYKSLIGRDLLRPPRM